MPTTDLALTSRANPPISAGARIGHVHLKVADLQRSLDFYVGVGGGRIVQISSEGGQIAYPAFGLYHATKWGIEGFVEAVAQEVAPFGIDFLPVEPGPTGTNFKAGLSQAIPMAEYDRTPAADGRRSLENGGFGVPADADKSVSAMIDAMDADKPALRLTLGSNAYNSISKALAGRLQALEAQKSVALGVDAGG